MNIQATQNEKVDLFITKGMKALQIKPVCHSVAGVVTVSEIIVYRLSPLTTVGFIDYYGSITYR